MPLMDDRSIVDLYWARDERAISESDAKYGRSCLQISMNILENFQDAEECVNDTYLRAWEAMPPKRPSRLGAFLARITRNLSIDRYRSNHAAKRGHMLFSVPLDELTECIPNGSLGYEDDFHPGMDIELESARIGAAINRFLRRQRPEVRDVFICRYFYSDSIGEITARFGMTDSQVKSMLSRARARLRKHLESEGITL